ncbi:OmpA family protein [Clostridium thermarum]|uniref:OmpA family protein n=1 Tax=Clostridium thermarum TaxID=1716543 RepID=UPI00111DFBCA|nr:OmpA family protein [Clostridium thermarum]
MARKKSGGSGGPSGGEWLATYSDTMTLLLTFFILLYSFSSVDAQKLKQLAASLQTVFTGQANNAIFDYNMKYGEVPLVGENSFQDQIPIDKSTGDPSMYETVSEFIEKNKLEAVVQITEDSRGIIIQLRDNILFESGSADIKEDSKNILEKISTLVSSFPNEIIIEGHTDNVPIHNQKFASNWELSSARAISVLKYFVEVKKIDPYRVSAHGYGEYRPVKSNDTPQNRAANRRVNILIVTKEGVSE